MKATKARALMFLLNTLMVAGAAYGVWITFPDAPLNKHVFGWAMLFFFWGVTSIGIFSGAFDNARVATEE